MKRLAPILICGMLLSISATGQTPPEALARAVVHLEIDQAAWENVGTNHFEMWYHVPGATNALRKVIRAGGTGFLLQHHAMTYIVTAAHVVGERVCAGDDQGSVALRSAAPF
jgi:hypothetical protein